MEKRNGYVRFLASMLGCDPRLYLAFLILGGLTLSYGCAKTKPIVVIDDWWNVDFAKNDCALRAASNDPCVVEPTFEVRDFEAQLDTAFATDPACGGVVLEHLSGTEPYWLVMIDFHLGKSTQHWSMAHTVGSDHKAYPYTSGRGTPKEIMHTVCAVITQAGGSVVN